MIKLKLLGVGTNAKTIKGDGSEYLTAILYLAPEKQVDKINVCPMAKIANCAAACLYTAGRGKFNNVQQARIRKTVLYRDNRKLFIKMLINDLERFAAYCEKRNIQGCIRLNGTSDIRFERFGIMEKFPQLIFYDYTKDYNRLFKKLPSNYHLTLSYSEANKDYSNKCIEVANKTNKNLAVVFRNKSQLPDRFLGRKVIDGDEDDLRFLDDNNVIVGLYAKGEAKKDYSGFVVG